MQPDLFELQKHLVDINSPKDIPKEVLKMFWDIKDEIGTTPLGISNIGDTWYVVCPAKENPVLWSGMNLL